MFGSLGILWFIAWSVLVYDGPDVHPRIAQEEREYLQVGRRKYLPVVIKIFCQSSLSECEAEKPRSIPWRSIVTSGPVWAITATHVTQVTQQQRTVWNTELQYHPELRLLRPADGAAQLHEECPQLRPEEQGEPPQ